ncbi:hypothetical protein NQ314_008014 [Rhamnusium bicolor]|uniref:Uncharacterized protein n=1 Tax=Rhamnusium bicolor TaxID=1586634 RepID=A0AAV8YFG4_9CUCU|nr:hypothetical protein NQ314_008014 [Rhamnusium bicolor]
MNDFENECMIVEDRTTPTREQRRVSNESRNSTSSTSSVKRKSQASLLDAGFSRTTDTPPLERNYSSGSISERNRRSSSSSLNRTNSFEHRSKPQQQKLTSFGHTRSVVEADSTTVVSSQVIVARANEQVQTLAPAIGDLMVYVDVKIEGEGF